MYGEICEAEVISDRLLRWPCTLYSESWEAANGQLDNAIVDLGVELLSKA
jgi:hypothetical protein